MSRGTTSRFSARIPVTKPVVIIVSEGKVTEKQYVKLWHRQYRTKFSLITPDLRGSDPLSLVNLAISCKSEYSNPKDGPIIWCVGDQDEHTNLSEALNLARVNGIKYALSIPCIELWFVLHFEEQTAFISKEKVQSKCRRHLKNYEKSLDDKHRQDLFDFYDLARRRAIALEKWHREKYITEALRNPSSNMWDLVDELKRLGT